MDRYAKVRGGTKVSMMAAGSLLVAFLATTVQGAAPLGPWSGDQIIRAGAETAWQLDLPLGYTGEIRAYYLLGPNLYAIGVDGVVRAIRVDTGKQAWIRKIVAPYRNVWPPVAVHVRMKHHRLIETPDEPVKKVEKTAQERVNEAAEAAEEAMAAEAGAEQADESAETDESQTKGLWIEFDAVVFTLAAEALFLDPDTGEIRERLPLISSTNAGIAVSEDRAFVPGPGGRVRGVRLFDGLKEWGVGAEKLINIAPVYVGGENPGVYLADEGGLVARLNEMGEKQFVVSVHAKPQGWLGVNESSLFVATAAREISALDRLEGAVQWEQYLAGRPQGGPVVTAEAVYQAIEEGGLHRFALGEGEPSWFNAKAKQFVARWPNRVVILQADGHLGLVPTDSRTGEPAELLAVGQGYEAISNPANDVIILASKLGRIKCLRPLGSKPLTARDLAPVVVGATQIEPAEPGEEALVEEAAPAEPVGEAIPSASDELNLADPLRSTGNVGP